MAQFKIIREEPVSLWIEVVCQKCGNTVGSHYKNAHTAQSIRLRTKDWKMVTLDNDDILVLCPDCIKELNEVDRDSAPCMIRMVGLYGNINNHAYFRKSGDLWNFCGDSRAGTVFQGGMHSEEVQEIMKNSSFYLKQFNACCLEVVPVGNFK